MFTDPPGANDNNFFEDRSFLNPIVNALPTNGQFGQRSTIQALIDIGRTWAFAHRGARESALEILVSRVEDISPLIKVTREVLMWIFGQYGTMGGKIEPILSNKLLMDSHSGACEYH